MSETIKIFKSLETYFEILCANEKCTNFSGTECKELIKILSQPIKDETKCTDNFINALKTFAIELKKADSPISLYTIKGKLGEIFRSSKNRDLNDISTNVNNANLSGFKMENDNGEGSTYRDILKNIIESNVKIDNEKIFTLWIENSFPLYSQNKKYFENEIKPKLNKINLCQLRILNEFFKIKVNGETVSIKDYIEKMETEYKDKEARLNAIVENGKATITNLLPDTLIDAFNEFLIKPPHGDKEVPEFVYDRNCYSLKLTSTEPSTETYKVPSPKAILDWAKIEVYDDNRKRQNEIVDGADEEPYVDADGETYKFPDSFVEIINYTDKWRSDLTGRLLKKDEKTGKFVEYNETDLLKDVESFQTADGNCGKLCIFNKPEECAKFFERMMKKDTLSMEELSKIINDKNFITSYKALKENITSVNPLFVIGTLRMFGFDKYTELKDDGTKVVRIESFTRWWNRYGSKITGLTGAQHKNVPPFVPEPPANLELFFKLLILFINNNEFVLNPQTKELTNKSKTKSVDKIPPFEYLIDKNGNKVKNLNYEKEKAIFEGKIYNDSKPESLSNLVDLMRKNSQLGAKTVNMALPENRANLNTLLGLMVGVTNGGHLRLARTPAYSTGKGYIPIVGGGYDEKVKMLPCSKNAHEIYKIGVETLKKKNKKLSESENFELNNELTELNNLEQKVYYKLNTLAHYVKIINVMNDEAQNDNVTLSMMDKAIQDYENSSNKLAAKSDTTISILLKKLFDDRREAKSYYSKLN